MGNNSSSNAEVETDATAMTDVGETDAKEDSVSCEPVAKKQKIAHDKDEKRGSDAIEEKKEHAAAEHHLTTYDQLYAQKLGVPTIGGVLSLLRSDAWTSDFSRRHLASLGRRGCYGLPSVLGLGGDVSMTETKDVSSFGKLANGRMDVNTESFEVTDELKTVIATLSCMPRPVSFLCWQYAGQGELRPPPVWVGLGWFASPDPTMSTPCARTCRLMSSLHDDTPMIAALIILLTSEVSTKRPVEISICARIGRDRRVYVKLSVQRFCVYLCPGCLEFSEWINVIAQPPACVQPHLTCCSNEPGLVEASWKDHPVMSTWFYMPSAGYLNSLVSNVPRLKAKFTFVAPLSGSVSSERKRKALTIL